MVVEVVGASPIGQASAAAGKTSATSAARARVLSARPIMPISGRLKRLECAIKSANSGVSPELDKASTASPARIIPKSPCDASAGCTKSAGVPVEAMVAAIFRATWPDFPMPETTTRPVTPASKPTARTKPSSKLSDSARSASASSASTRRPSARSGWGARVFTPPCMRRRPSRVNKFRGWPCKKNASGSSAPISGGKYPGPHNPADQAARAPAGNGNRPPPNPTGLRASTTPQASPTAHANAAHQKRHKPFVLS